MKLVVLDGPMRGLEFSVAGPAVILGRDAGADVRLGLDPHVSLFHCQLTNEGGQFWLEDMAGSSGTRVYGKPQQKRTPLFAGDTFRLGRTRLSLVEDATSVDELLEPHPDSPPAASAAETAPAGQASRAREDEVEDATSVTATADPTQVLTSSEAQSSPAVQRVLTRLRVIQDITEDLAGKVDSASLLETVLERVTRILKSDRAFIFELASQSSEPLLVATRRLDGEPGTGELKPSRAILQRLLRSRVAMLIDDARLDKSYAASQSLSASPYRSIMCVPLVHGERMAGFIYLDSLEPKAFTREELELVTVIANQAAAGLANTRLYEKLSDAYKELESAHDQLVQTEKLATIGGLAASISHDIGNVLTPIQGIASMVLASESVPPQFKESFERQMQRLKALASQLLSFSSPKPPELVPVDLNKAVKDSLLLVTTEARHSQVEIVTQLDERLPAVAADVNRLDQAFVNLMLNAIQAMEKTGGGRLTIRSEVEGSDVVLSFRDTGPGIPESVLRNLGKPFFTTKGRQGNGLGVFGCKRIVEEEHGGKLEIESQVGAGATFRIRLPRRRSLLLVDDDDDYVALVKARMEDAKFIVVAASDGEQALEKVASWVPDVIVSDVMMPKLDGWGLVRRLRSQSAFALVPVIFLTSLDAKEDRSRGFQIGADDYLAKDRHEELEERVNLALERRARLEKALTQERPAQAQAGARPGIRGTLDQMGLPSILTFIEMERRTGVLRLERAGDRGSVFVNAGRVHAARLEGSQLLENAEALYTFLEWSDGSFEFLPEPVEMEDEVRMDTQNLLLEGARLQDEAGAMGDPLEQL